MLFVRGLLFVSALFASGCAAYKIPERLYNGVNESRTVEVRIRSDENVDYELERFESALVNVEGLTFVDDSMDRKPHDIVANLKTGYDGRCFAEPMLTVLTLGIFPSIGCAPHGFLFELSGGPLSEPTLVDTRGDVPLVWGWAAMFVLLSDDWVGGRGLAKYEAKHLGETIYRVMNKPEE